MICPYFANNAANFLFFALFLLQSHPLIDLFVWLRLVICYFTRVGLLYDYVPIYICSGNCELEKTESDIN